MPNQELLPSSDPENLWMLIKFGGQRQNSGLSAHNLMASAIEISAAHGVINTDETNHPPSLHPPKKFIHFPCI